MMTTTKLLAAWLSLLLPASSSGSSLDPQQFATCANSLRQADQDHNSKLSYDEFKVFYSKFVHHCPLQLFLEEEQVQHALDNPSSELEAIYNKYAVDGIDVTAATSMDSATVQQRYIFQNLCERTHQVLEKMLEDTAARIDQVPEDTVFFKQEGTEDDGKTNGQGPPEGAGGGGGPPEGAGGGGGPPEGAGGGGGPPGEGTGGPPEGTTGGPPEGTTGGPPEGTNGGRPEEGTGGRPENQGGGPPEGTNGGGPPEGAGGGPPNNNNNPNKPNRTSTDDCTGNCKPNAQGPRDRTLPVRAAFVVSNTDGYTGEDILATYAADLESDFEISINEEAFADLVMEKVSQGPGNSGQAGNNGNVGGPNGGNGNSEPGSNGGGRPEGVGNPGGGSNGKGSNRTSVDDNEDSVDNGDAGGRFLEEADFEFTNVTVADVKDSDCPEGVMDDTAICHMVVIEFMLVPGNFTRVGQLRQAVKAALVDWIDAGGLQALDSPFTIEQGLLRGRKPVLVDSSFVIASPDGKTAAELKSSSDSAAVRTLKDAYKEFVKGVANEVGADETTTEVEKQKGNSKNNGNSEPGSNGGLSGPGSSQGGGKPEDDQAGSGNGNSNRPNSTSTDEEDDGKPGNSHGGGKPQDGPAGAGNGNSNRPNNTSTDENDGEDPGNSQGGGKPEDGQEGPGNGNSNRPNSTSTDEEDDGRPGNNQGGGKPEDGPAGAGNGNSNRPNSTSTDEDENEGPGNNQGGGKPEDGPEGPGNGNSNRPNNTSTDEDEDGGSLGNNQGGGKPEGGPIGPGNGNSNNRPNSTSTDEDDEGPGNQGGAKPEDGPTGPGNGNSNNRPNSTSTEEDDEGPGNNQGGGKPEDGPTGPGNGNSNNRPNGTSTEEANELGPVAPPGNSGGREQGSGEEDGDVGPVGPPGNGQRPAGLRRMLQGNGRRSFEGVGFDTDSAEIYDFEDAACGDTVTAVSKQVEEKSNCIVVFGKFRVYAEEEESVEEIYEGFREITQEYIANGTLEEKLVEVAAETNTSVTFELEGASSIVDQDFDAYVELVDDANETSTDAELAEANGDTLSSPPQREEPNGSEDDTPASNETSTSTENSSSGGQRALSFVLPSSLTALATILLSTLN